MTKHTSKFAKQYYKFRLSLRKRWHELKGEKYYVKRVNGVTLLLDKDNYVDRHVDTFGGYEDDRIEYLGNLIAENQCDRFIDIGAHWGLYSLRLAEDPRFSALTIDAFEADRINSYQLYANLFLNRLERITVHAFGLADHAGTVRFNRQGDYNRGNSSISDEGEHEIRVDRFDSVLPLNGQRLAFKIDVEGKETAVLAGMQEALSKNACVLQIESFGDVAAAELLAHMPSGYLHVHSIDCDHYFSNG